MVEESNFVHVGVEASQILAKAFARSSLKSKACYEIKSVKNTEMAANANIKPADHAGHLAKSAAST